MDRELNFNTGNPDKLIDSRFNKKSKSLKDTKLELLGAQNRITNMINGDLNGLQHFNTVDLATMAEVSTSIAHGIEYLEMLDERITKFSREYGIDIVDR